MLDGLDQLTKTVLLSDASSRDNVEDMEKESETTQSSRLTMNNKISGES